MMLPLGSLGLTPERAQRLDAFLDRAGWGAAVREPLPVDASFRSYIRLRDGLGSAIVMNAPPPQEDVGPFLAVAELLHRLGLSAPRVLASEREAGFLLLEDLGEDSFTRVLARAPESERSLYELATDTIAALQRRRLEQGPLAGEDAIAPYDSERLLTEARLLTEWYLPEVEGRATSHEVQTSYEAAWRAALARLEDLPRTLVLRDCHVDNMIWLPEREGVAACGLLDFQDALIGSTAYDLVSLLEDARRDLPESLREAMILRYLKAAPPQDEEAFRAAYRILGAQRHAKVIGIFTRLWRRDGKSRYLAHLPRLWGLLGRALQDPALAPVAQWFDANLPPAKRLALKDPLG